MFQVSIIGAIERQLNAVKKPREKRLTQSKLTFKQLRARRSHDATVKMINKLQSEKEKN